MTETTIDLKIYSPRWGTTDAYEVLLKRDALEIRKGPGSAKLVYHEKVDPKWEGDDLISMLERDSIYPPAVLPRLFRHAWLEWRAYELDDSGVEEELIKIADWLNDISRLKPSSEFWRGFF